MLIDKKIENTLLYTYFYLDRKFIVIWTSINRCDLDQWFSTWALRPSSGPEKFWNGPGDCSVLLHFLRWKEIFHITWNFMWAWDSCLTLKMGHWGKRLRSMHWFKPRDLAITRMLNFFCRKNLLFRYEVRTIAYERVRTYESSNYERNWQNSK